MLGHEPHRYCVIDRAALYRPRGTALERVGGGIDPRTPLGDLSPGQKQRVEIARALSLNAKILLLDEPTATLTETDAARLFELLRELRKQGLGMVYISHRLARGPGDHRSHRLPARRPEGRRGCRPSEATLEKLVEFLAGAGGVYSTDAEPLPPPDRGRAEVAAACTSICTRARSWAWRAWSARAAPACCAGCSAAARAAVNLQVKMRGKPVSIAPPSDAIRPGFAYVPEERASQGLILDMLVERNIALPSL